LARTVEVAVTLKLIASKELSRIIVDSTVQEKAIVHPTDSKLLETARVKLVEAAKAEGIELKQTYAKEGQLLGYKAGRYAHARQFKCMYKAIKRQRTIVGRLHREISRKMTTLSQAIQDALGVSIDKAKRLIAQSRSKKAQDKQPKLYSWHVPCSMQKWAPNSRIGCKADSWAGVRAIQKQPLGCFVAYCGPKNGV
jgi:IS5 family transposase